MIKIVLVETSHSGNIGAVARAMKTMSIQRLCLVSPKIFPSAEATARAAGSDDILANAQICHNLAEALADCQLVFGASARSRTISWPEVSARECAQLIAQQPNAGLQIAIVFGRESSGLRNQELDLCHYLLHIPCDQSYSSLNIAAAVQVICYELFVAAKVEQVPVNVIGDKDAHVPATMQQMELFYQHLHQTLLEIGFMDPLRSKSMMPRLRRLYNRVQLDYKEVNILRGILRLSQQHHSKSS